MKKFRKVGLMVAVAALAVGGVACGDDDDSDAQDSTDTTEESTDSTDESTIEVEMIDYEFVGLPETVSVGTKLAITNTSPGEVHELVAFRLPDDEDRPVDELVELPDEEIDALLSGMPAMVLVAGPDGPQIDAVGDGTLSEPGRYIVICAIPTGADPDEYFEAAESGGDGPPDVEGGPPHLVHGMYAELVVE